MAVIHGYGRQKIQKKKKKPQKDEMVNSDLHQEYVFQKPMLQNVKE